MALTIADWVVCGPSDGVALKGFRHLGRIIACDELAEAFHLLLLGVVGPEDLCLHRGHVFRKVGLGVFVAEFHSLVHGAARSIASKVHAKASQELFR